MIQQIRSFLVAMAVMSCFSLQADLFCWNDIYVEAGGGFVTGLSRAKDDIGIGVISHGGNGIATNAQLLPSGFVEAKLGYRWCPWLRFDVSYTYVPAQYNWQEIFGDGAVFGFASDTVYESDLNSHIVLANAYIQFDQLCDLNPCWCVSPYIMGGVGAVWNNLTNIKQFVSLLTLTPPIQIAAVKDHTTSNFAARFGLGLLTRFYCVTFNTAVRATYINTIKTGNTQTSTAVVSGVGPVGTVLSVFPTEFRNNWLADFYVGVNYLF
jgi:hypothetical protein